MKKFIISIFLFTSIIFSQEKNNLIFGVKASVDIGRYNDRIELTPSLMKNINNYLFIGAGLTLLYYSNSSEVYLKKPDGFRTNKIKDKIWYKGGELFLRFIPFPQNNNFIGSFFLQTSFEKLFGKGTYKTSSNSYKYKVNNFTPFIGGGFSYDISNKITLSTLINFKLNHENNSPYRNPVIRFLIEF